jgi:hypothetical protein
MPTADDGRSTRPVFFDAAIPSTVRATALQAAGVLLLQKRSLATA